MVCSLLVVLLQIFSISIERSIKVIVLGPGLFVNLKRLTDGRLQTGLSPFMMMPFLWGLMEFRFLTVLLLIHFGLALQAFLIIFPLFAPSVLLSLLSLKSSLLLSVEFFFMSVLLLHHNPIGIFFTPLLFLLLASFLLTLLSLLLFLVKTALFLNLSLVLFKLAG